VPNVDPIERDLLLLQVIPYLKSHEAELVAAMVPAVDGGLESMRSTVEGAIRAKVPIVGGAFAAALDKVITGAEADMPTTAKEFFDWLLVQLTQFANS
jgi:hypothetical protein